MSEPRPSGGTSGRAASLPRRCSREAAVPKPLSESLGRRDEQLPVNKASNTHSAGQAAGRAASLPVPQRSREAAVPRPLSKSHAARLSLTGALRATRTVARSAPSCVRLGAPALALPTPPRPARQHQISHPPTLSVLHSCMGLVSRRG